MNRVTNAQLRYELERLLKRTTIKRLLDTLAAICFAKAGTVVWEKQNNAREDAKQWIKAAAAIETAMHQTPESWDDSDEKAEDSEPEDT